MTSYSVLQELMKLWNMKHRQGDASLAGSGIFYGAQPNSMRRSGIADLTAQSCNYFQVSE